MRYLFMLSTALLLTACACTKNSKNPQLPPITQEGKNTFGCKIDGDIFNPLSSFKLTGRRISVNYYISQKEDDKLFISVFDDGIGLEITITNPTLAPSFYLLNTENSYARVSNRTSEFFSKSNERGQLNILKIDTISKIVSGTFSFDAKENEGDKILKVTDGRFDLKLQVFNQ